MIWVNPKPWQIIHVGACGGAAFSCGLNAIPMAFPDVSTIESARVAVARPAPYAAELVYWPLVIVSDSQKRRFAYYRFKGVDVGQETPDLPVAGIYELTVEVNQGDGVWVPFGDDMKLKVTDRTTRRN